MGIGQVNAEFDAIYQSLTEHEKRALATWFALTKNHPRLFPRPENIEDATLIGFTSLLKLLADEIAQTC